MPNNGSSTEGGGDTAEQKKGVLMLMMFWYESSIAPSSWILLEDCVAVPVNRAAEDWNSHCFDCVHLPAIRQTRSFSALHANKRDEWVSVITLSSYKPTDRRGTPECPAEGAVGECLTAKPPR